MEVIKLQEDVYRLTKELVDVAKSYREARVNYSECQFKLRKLLSERISIYKRDKKNLGIEMAILTALGDTEYDKRVDFEKNYKGVEFYTALYKGYQLEFEAKQSEIMAIQSIMKYMRDGEDYGK